MRTTGLIFLVITRSSNLRPTLILVFLEIWVKEKDVLEWTNFLTLSIHLHLWITLSNTKPLTQIKELIQSSLRFKKAAFTPTLNHPGEFYATPNKRSHPLHARVLELSCRYSSRNIELACIYGLFNLYTTPSKTIFPHIYIKKFQKKIG